MVLRADHIVAALGCTISLAVLLLLPSQADPKGLDAIADPYSPGFFPIVIAGILFVVSAALGIAAVSSASAPAGERSIDTPGRLLITAAWILCYAWLISWLGMVIASVINVVVLSYVMGARNHFAIAAVAVAVPTGIHLLFERLLHVLLPEGKLF